MGAKLLGAFIDLAGGPELSVNRVNRVNWVNWVGLRR